MDTVGTTIGTALGERREMLFEAASLVDSLGSPLGTAGGATDDGQLLRDLAAETVGLAATPLVFRLDEQTFTGKGLPVPVTYQEVVRRHRLYWMCAPVALLPARHWGFNQLDARVDFNADGDGPRPTAMSILPDPVVEEVADVGGSVEVRVDPSLTFSVATPQVDLRPGGIPVAVGAALDVSAVASAHAALGPFRYRATRAVVSHTPVGMEYVQWRIDRAASLDGEGPALVVMLAVPHEVPTVTIDARIEARRYFRFASAPLLEKIRQLPSRLREFLLGDGAPVADTTRWDISSML